MSETESFEQAMEIARHVMCEECELIDDYGSLCLAHDDSCHDCEKSMIARLKAAHDREIRDVLQQAYHRGFRDGTQQEYHRGFEEGQHSMDAEHRAIAMRLHGLRFDGGSHENLSRIAYAIYPCATGWTCESADGLRDRLVDLMGGVSEPTFADQALDLMNTIIKESNECLQNDGKAEKPSNTEVGDDTCDSQCRGACAAGDCGCAGEQKEIGDDCVDCDILGSDARGHAVDCDFHELGVSDGRVADDCADDSRGGSRGELVHMDGLVTYDVLGNERRRVIAKLRKIPDVTESSYTYDEHLAMIYDALDVDAAPWSYSDLDEIRDNIIHLLGGDKPSGIDVLRAMDAESDADGTCPNDVPTSSITDELREWALSEFGLDCRDYDGAIAIADRIDEQFDRICQQQEAVLQETIDEVVKEYEHDRLPDQLRIEKLEKQRDHWRQQATDMMNHADAMEHERDELLDLLRDAREEYKTLDQMSAETSANFHAVRDRVWGAEMERDELRRKVDELENFDPETSIAAFGDDNGKLRRMLSRAAALLANAEQDRDANYAYWMDCKEKVVHANVTIEELQAKLDAITAALNG